MLLDENTIHITSGLIEYSKDYVALSVLAHEIGHIEKSYFSRKLKISNIKNIKNFQIYQ